MSLRSTDCLRYDRQYCIPLWQEQRKDYTLYLYWGRVQLESASSPKIIHK